MVDEKKEVYIRARIPLSKKQRLDTILRDVETTESDVLRNLLDEFLDSGIQKKRSTGYWCEKCSKKIFPNELYYIELANLEKFAVALSFPKKLEIETTDSLPLHILCLKCAQGKKKLSQFVVSEKKTESIKGFERARK